jgi:hypothetical protein
MMIRVFLCYSHGKIRASMLSSHTVCRILDVIQTFIMVPSEIKFPTECFMWRGFY